MGGREVRRNAMNVPVATAADEALLRPVWVQFLNHLAQSVLDFTDYLHQAKQSSPVDDVDGITAVDHGTQRPLEMLSSVGLLEHGEDSIPELLRIARARRHHRLLALHGLVTRYVTGPLLAAVRWLQRKGTARRPAGVRGPSDAGQAGA